MTVLLDANMLLLLLDSKLTGPKDANGQPVPQVNERMNYLVSELQRQREKIIIPTPALAEVLVRAAAAGGDYLTRLSRSSAFKIEPFDVRAAVEVASMTAEDIARGDKTGGNRAVWQKVKYDRQIVAIARIHQCSTIYTDDLGIRTFAKALNIPTVGVADLQLPSQDAQLMLPWNPTDDDEPPSPQSG